MNEPIRVGYTCVRVMYKNIDEQTGKETIHKIHEGVIIENCKTFVRVYNVTSLGNGGDASPETAQLYPLAGKRLWCEFVAERSTKFPIPPLFS